MAFKCWKKTKDRGWNLVFETNKKIGLNKLPKGTIQIFGEGNKWNIGIYEASPAPRDGWYLNRYVFRRDNLRGGQLNSKFQALKFAKSYMKKNDRC